MGNRVRAFSTFARIGGVAVIALEWDISLNAYSAADEFKLTLPLKETIKSVSDLQALSQKTIPLEVQILGGFTSSPGKMEGLPILFAGPLDCVDADFTQSTYEVTGRSWAYQLLAEKTTLVFQNMTTDAIAKATAAKHGLAYDNGGKPSSNIAGKIYDQAQAKSSRKITEWDLLTDLARAEDREVYVIGKTLFYVPSVAEEDPAKGPEAQWIFRWEPDSGLAANEFALDDLKVAHYAQFSHDIKVVVINHDPNTGHISSLNYGASDYAAAIAKKRRGGASTSHTPHRRKPSRQVSSLSAPAIGTKEIYPVSVHGKTPQQVQDIAYSKYKEITRHELVATVELDGTPAFGIRDVAAIQGTGTIADTRYRFKKLALACKQAGKGHGLSTTATLANHVPQPVGEGI
jgi:hypothetical protein